METRQQQAARKGTLYGLGSTGRFPKTRVKKKDRLLQYRLDQEPRDWRRTYGSDHKVPGGDKEPTELKWEAVHGNRPPPQCIKVVGGGDLHTTVPEVIQLDEETVEKLKDRPQHPASWKFGYSNRSESYELSGQGQPLALFQPSDTALGKVGTIYTHQYTSQAYPPLEITTARVTPQDWTVSCRATPSFSCFNVATPGGWDESSLRPTTSSDPNKVSFPRNPSNKGPTAASGPVAVFSDPELTTLVSRLQLEEGSITSTESTELSIRVCSLSEEDKIGKHPKQAIILVNDRQVAVQERGFNIVVINCNTHGIEHTKSFDTGSHSK